MSLPPPHGLPPHVRAAAGPEAVLFAVQARSVPLRRIPVVVYAGLLFLGTALALVAMQALEGWDVGRSVFVLVFGALGLFILLKVARPAAERTWFVGTRAALHVVARGGTTTHAWRDLAPDVEVDARPGRGGVTLSARRAMPETKPMREHPSPTPLPVGIHDVDDAPRLARACLHLIEGDPDAAASALRATPGGPATSHAPLPTALARALAPRARPDFAHRGRPPWEEHAKRLLLAAVLAALLAAMGSFTLLSSELLGKPESGPRSATFLGFETTYDLRVETSVTAAALMLAWFVVPLAFGLLFALRRAWTGWRHGRWSVGTPEALVTAEGDTVRLVSWTRVGADVRVRGREIHVPLRAPPGWTREGVEPETLVLTDVAEPGPIVRALASRQAARASSEGP